MLSAIEQDINTCFAGKGKEEQLVLGMAYMQSPKAAEEWKGEMSLGFPGVRDHGRLYL